MRNSFKLLAATFAVGAVAFGSTCANANPITLYYSFDGTNFTTAATSLDGTATYSPAAGITSGGTTYSVQFTATGTGANGVTPLPAPNFNTNTITATASGGGTIYLAAIETGITNTNVASFRIGFTNNDSDVGVMESFFVGSSFNLGSTPLATAMMAPNSNSLLNYTAPALTAPYSVAELYKITFTAPGQQVNATISERAVVPEPVSIALLGTGLVTLGMIRRRKRV